NREAQTALAKIRERLADGSERIVHRMGDVGWFDADGRLWFCGRKSQRVETADGPLYTEQVEPVFNVHPDVRRTALVGIGAPGARCCAARPMPACPRASTRASSASCARPARVTRTPRASTPSCSIRASRWTSATMPRSAARSWPRGQANDWEARNEDPGDR